MIEEFIESIKNLCYQCEFQKVVSQINHFDAVSIGSQDHFSLQLYKSQALFEMHQVTEAKRILQELAHHHEKHSEPYLYVRAKLYYTDRDWEQSARIFRLLIDQSESVKDYFKAVLGLANVFASINDSDGLERLLPELAEMQDMVNPDQKLSYLLLRGNALFRQHNDENKALTIFYDVIRYSQSQQWNYFVIKSLYSIASVYHSCGKLQALESILQLLRCYMKPNETVYLTHLVNQRFKDVNFSLTSALEFDHERKRVAVQGKWIPLHDKPLIYGFLKFLFQRGDFASKAEIAATLWPQDEYNGRVHDPRIFDIARRVRALIEPYEDQPICLLSGRFGYKLAGDEQANGHSSTIKADDSLSAHINHKQQPFVAQA